MTRDDLSPAELAFRELMRDRRAYAKWAAGVLKAWKLTPAGILACRKRDLKRGT